MVNHGSTDFSFHFKCDYDISEKPHTARRIFGTMTVPNYTEETGPGVLLTRDENGLPFYNGDREIEFTIVVLIFVLPSLLL